MFFIYFYVFLQSSKKIRDNKIAKFVLLNLYLFFDDLVDDALRLDRRQKNKQTKNDKFVNIDLKLIRKHRETIFLFKLS